MRSIFILFTVFVCYATSFSQTIYEEFDSHKLGEKRGIKIRLPQNYNPEGDLKYPLILVLDGDYLFEPVAGNIDYQAYWDEIPDCIVVGVKQELSRESDFEFTEETFMPSQDGATFYEFISMELLPYIKSNYNTSSFDVVLGHDLGANFINYYIFKELPLFDAYVALSPDFALKTPKRLATRLEGIESELFYYLASSDGDVRLLRQSILETDKKLKGITNSKLHYKFDDFTGSNHYTLVSQAIPEALSEVFKYYKPINKQEYKEELLPYTGTTFEYLEKKYNDIEYYYGLKKPVIENDLRAIAAACKNRNDNESLLKLAKLARKTYPESMIGAYYLGLYNEETGNYKKALQRYQSGLLLTPSLFIDKDFLLDKIYEIKDENF